jgi:predicted RNase H-related nuclease YkuK (DUF458 family)
MHDIECKAKIEDDKILIENLKDSPVTIDISIDVDFTNIITVLSELIEKGSQINLTIENVDSIEDEKEKLIVETLKEVFNKFNEALLGVVYLEEDNAPW